MSRRHLRIFQDDILMRTYSYSLLNHKEVHLSSTNRAIRSIKGRKSLQYFSSNCDKSLHWHFFMMNCKVSCTRVVEEWQWSCMGRIQIYLELRVLLLLNLTLIKIIWDWKCWRIKLYRSVSKRITCWVALMNGVK